MTKEELKKYKQQMPLAISKLPIEFVEDHIEDKYGVYETGVFQYKDKIFL